MTTTESSSARALAELVGFLIDLEFTNLPSDVQVAARLRVVDAVAARAAGVGSDIDRALRGMEAIGLSAGSTGHTADWQATVGAALAHRHEADDIYDDALLCIGGLVVPTALAVGGARGASGRAVLTAIVAGYETMGRLGAAIGSSTLLARGWWPSAVCGAAGAAVVTALLLEFTGEALIDALTLAIQHSGGLVGGETGVLGRNLLYGSVARAGVLAASAARNGLYGPTDVLDGARSFATAFGITLAPEKLTAGLGEQYVVARTTIKPYACARQLHAAVEAALALRAEGLNADAIEQVTLALPAESALFNRPAGDDVPDAPAGSAQWVLASALLRGSMLPDDLTFTALDQPAVRALAERVAVNVGAPGERQSLSGTLTVQAGGKTLERAIPVPRGGPARPLSADAVLAKAHALAASSIGAAAAAQLIAQTQSLETAETVGELASPRAGNS